MTGTNEAIWRCDRAWVAEFNGPLCNDPESPRRRRRPLEATRRCSTIGVNILQKRLGFYLTRLEVETSVLSEAFSHTCEESDVLEEWVEEFHDVGPTPTESFDA